MHLFFDDCLESLDEIHHGIELSIQNTLTEARQLSQTETLYLIESICLLWLQTFILSNPVHSRFID